jgi:hypothetical protein
MRDRIFFVVVFIASILGLYSSIVNNWLIGIILNGVGLYILSTVLAITLAERER